MNVPQLKALIFLHLITSLDVVFDVRSYSFNLLHSSLHFFTFSDAPLLNMSFILLLLFFFSDRGSVIKISQLRGFSHACLYSEMEVYPVSVQ